jgi:formylglycine-generating enzyme required for sulfatase activity
VRYGYAPPAYLIVLAAVMAAPACAGEAREPGSTFRDCLDCPEMVVLPAGSFVMGTNGRYKYERPAHRVALARPFAIGKFELTFEEWGACIDGGGCERMPDGHKWGRGAGGR